MNPMVSMILKWEKELERPDHALIQRQNLSRLLKSKEEIQPKRKSVETIGVKEQSICTDPVTHQTCHELA